MGNRRCPSLDAVRPAAHTGRHRGAIGARMSDPTKVSRRLVAVFAADVEGYSRLMGADEVGTLMPGGASRPIYRGDLKPSAGW